MLLKESSEKFTSSVPFNVTYIINSLVYDLSMLQCLICSYAIEKKITKMEKQNPTYLPTYLPILSFLSNQPQAYFFCFIINIFFEFHDAFSN